MTNWLRNGYSHGMPYNPDCKTLHLCLLITRTWCGEYVDEQELANPILQPLSALSLRVPESHPSEPRDLPLVLLFAARYMSLLCLLCFYMGQRDGCLPLPV